MGSNYGPVAWSGKISVPFARHIGSKEEEATFQAPLKQAISKQSPDLMNTLEGKLSQDTLIVISDKNCFI